MNAKLNVEFMERVASASGRVLLSDEETEMVISAHVDDDDNTLSLRITMHPLTTLYIPTGLPRCFDNDAMLLTLARVYVQGLSRGMTNAKAARPKYTRTHTELAHDVIDAIERHTETGDVK